MIKLSKTPKYITAVLFLFVFQIILSVPQAIAALDPIPGVPNKAIADVIADATNWILGVALAISVVMLIYGGLTYVSSSGSTEQTATSKKIIKYALLGVFIAGMSYIFIAIIDQIIG